MDDAKKKRILAMVAIVVAVALIATSIVALVVTNTSAENTNSQTEQVQSNEGDTNGSHGDSTSSASENNDGNHASSTSSTSSTSDGNHGSSTSSTSDGNHENSQTSNYGSHQNTSNSDGSHQNASTSEGSHESTVYITIDGAGHGNVSYADNVTVEKGASVYDALKATGMSINARDSQYGTYVAAIGGLAEKSAGGESGWKYSVNGVEPNTACSNYKLKSGDVIKWKFVTKASEAVG